MSRRFISPVVSLALLLTALCWTAGHADEPNNFAAQALHSGAKALQFGVSGGIFSTSALTSLTGATLSYKKLSMDRSGWRLGLTLAASDHRSDQVYEYVDSVTHADSEVVQSSDNNVESLRLGYDHLHYFEPFNRAAAFLAYGPFGSFTHRHSSYTENDWSLGLRLEGEVELFALRNLSFEAGYGLEAAYSRGSAGRPERDAPGLVFRRTVSKDISITSPGVTLGASFYFR